MHKPKLTELGSISRRTFTKLSASAAMALAGTASGATMYLYDGTIITTADELDVPSIYDDPTYTDPGTVNPYPPEDPPEDPPEEPPVVPPVVPPSYPEGGRAIPIWF